MIEGNNVSRTPLLQLEEVIDVLRLSEDEGLTFQAISLHLFNRHQGLFGDGPSLRSIHCSLRQVLRANLQYFTLSEDGYYKLRQAIPQQLFIDFSTKEHTYSTEQYQPDSFSTPPATDLRQMEIDFYDFCPTEATNGSTDCNYIVAEERIQYSGGDEQLLLDF